MAVTFIGIASGISTTLINMAISQKTKGRVEIGRGEVAMAMLAVGIGSAAGYFFIKSKEQAMLEGELIEDTFMV